MGVIVNGNYDLMIDILTIDHERVNEINKLVHKSELNSNDIKCE